jgi:hypothetical protein
MTKSRRAAAEDETALQPVRPANRLLLLLILAAVRRAASIGVIVGAATERRFGGRPVRQCRNNADIAASPTT